MCELSETCVTVWETGVAGDRARLSSDILRVATMWHMLVMFFFCFLFISVKPNERLTKLTNTLRFISYCCCFLFMKWVQPNTKKPKQSPIFRQYSIVWTGQQAEVWWCMVHSPLVCSLYFFFLRNYYFLEPNSERLSLLKNESSARWKTLKAYPRATQ